MGSSRPFFGLARFQIVLTALIGTVVIGCSGPFPQSTFDSASSLGAELSNLFGTIFGWALAVFVVVEALLVYTLIRYRARPGQEGEPKYVHGHTVLEIAWTLAPAAILVFIAVPTMQTIFRIDGTPAAGAIEVEVIGHQWWWEYRYSQYGVTTANELHLPVGRPAALAMTSADVIHSFWVPLLGGKRDVVQGRTNRLSLVPDSIGEFMGQCAEFCGLSHANMRTRVVVEDSVSFEQWVTRQVSDADVPDSGTAEARGEEIWTGKGICFSCHTIQGVRSVARTGPDLTHAASRSTIAGGILPNDAAGLARWLRDPPAEKPGSLMPKLPLTEDEISALVAYLQSLK
ncbi:MAG: cytochrome c oxidase subunit II [Gemmatimonadales bacterium]